MKCKYCGREVKQYRTKEWCATCDNKLSAVKRFVEECDRFKELIRYWERREAKR